jgi:hypothetical protein
MGKKIEKIVIEKEDIEDLNFTSEDNSRKNLLNEFNLEQKGGNIDNDLDYGEYTIEAYTDHSDYETPSFQTELNEEDDAKICHVFWHLFNITTINCHTTTNGKINTSYLQNFLEPPCLS